MNLLGDCKRHKFFIMMGNKISRVQLWTLVGLVLWLQEGSTHPQPKMMCSAHLDWHAGVLLLLKDFSYLINLPSGETPMPTPDHIKLLWVKSCPDQTFYSCSAHASLRHLWGWISLFQNEGHCFKSHCLTECRQCKCSGKSEHNWCSSLFGGAGLGTAKEEFMGFPGGLTVKNLSANAGDMASISGLGRSPGEGNGSPLQFSH